MQITNNLTWWRVVTTILILLYLAACDTKEKEAAITPPVARIEPKVTTIHGHKRIDNYDWIRDDTRSDPEVIALLEAENDYTRAMMSGSTGLRDELFHEITARLQDTDSTVPVKEGKYYYHREFRAGGEYPVYFREPADTDGRREVILDVNELSRGYEYYQLANWSVSRNGKTLAFAEDTLSRREYTIRFKDLESGEILPDRIKSVERNIAWANDNRTMFYVVKHPQTLRPYRVYRHLLGTSVSQDQMVYEETDPGFYISVYTSRSHEFVVISIQSTDASEIQLIDAHEPTSQPRIFWPREPGHEYRLRHVPGRFYILTNWRAPNFRLMSATDSGSVDRPGWKEVVPHRTHILLQDIEVFSDHIAVNELIGGLPQLRVIDRDSGESHTIAFNDPAYTAWLHSNPEVTAKQLRYVYSSLTTPDSVYEYDMDTRQTRLLKQDEVIGDFDPADYTSERVYITVRDGTKVPVSLVYKTADYEHGRNPLYIKGYGSYGLSLEPEFDSLRLSLLDRGFVYAIAHIRGGQEMGRRWYENGKLFNKQNTFQDFIDVTRALVDKGYGASDKVFASGASAGGLLMGVIANEAPELYRGIVARVPFVDVMNTMLDESIPLTAGEYTEWGNPHEKAAYDYMLAYSPYDQVKPQAYPNMLITTGLWDSQVQYFEPVKWVSKLRKMKTDDNLLLLHVDMNTGHGGASGRYERYRMDALAYAFILKTLSRPRS
ncbi:MAG: S9 family peptidase [Pseudomonadales bacterium]